MKWLLIFLTCLASHLLTTQSLLAALNRDERASRYFEFKIDYWHTLAHAWWEISFPVFAGIPKSAISMGSTLDYNDIASNLIVLTWEVRPLRKVSFDFFYGYNNIHHGGVVDSDWIQVYGYEYIFWQSIADTTGKARLIGFDTYLQVYSHSRRGRVNRFWDIFAGYQWYEDRLKMRNGLWITPPAGTIEGLDSIYNFKWHGLRLGVREKWSLRYNFFLEGKVAFWPFVKYEGDAFWNLRVGTDPKDFRSTFPNFTQNARGTGWDLSFSAAYSFNRRFLIRAGYKAIFLRATHGIDKTFFYDGTVAETDLDKVKARRSGIFFGLSFKY